VGSLSDCLSIRKQIFELDILCSTTCKIEDKNTFHYCGWEGNLVTLQEHLADECAFAFVICPKINCGSKILRRDLNSHNEWCHPETLIQSPNKVIRFIYIVVEILLGVLTQIIDLFSTINHFDERRWFSPTFIAILSHFNLNCLDVCVLSVTWRVLLPLCKWLCSHLDLFHVFAFEIEFEYDHTHYVALATVVMCLIAVQITAYCLHCNALFSSVSVVVIIVSVVPRLSEIVTVNLMGQFGLSDLIANIVGHFIVPVLVVRAVKPIITMLWSLLPALFKNE
jgi:hypothetical protein